MTFEEFKPGMKVYDQWWAERIGTVKKIAGRRVVVEWSDGKVWQYDREHCPFLNIAGTATAGRS